MQTMAIFGFAILNEFNVCTDALQVCKHVW